MANNQKGRRSSFGPHTLPGMSIDDTEYPIVPRPLDVIVHRETEARIPTVGESPTSVQIKVTRLVVKRIWCIEIEIEGEDSEISIEKEHQKA